MTPHLPPSLPWGNKYLLLFPARQPVPMGVGWEAAARWREAPSIIGAPSGWGPIPGGRYLRVGGNGRVGSAGGPGVGSRHGAPFRCLPAEPVARSRLLHHHPPRDAPPPNKPGLCLPQCNALRHLLPPPCPSAPLMMLLGGLQWPGRPGWMPPHCLAPLLGCLHPGACAYPPPPAPWGAPGWQPPKPPPQPLSCHAPRNCSIKPPGKHRHCQ